MLTNGELKTGRQLTLSLAISPMALPVPTKILLVYLNIMEVSVGQKGDIILQDIHGAGGVGGPDGVVDGNDKAVLSLYSKDPEIIYGISLGGEWKGLDFTAFFQGVGHRSIMFP